MHKKRTRAQAHGLRQRRRAELLARCLQWRQQAELLAKCLQWYVDNDDTNDTEDNKPWLEGKQAAVAALQCMPAVTNAEDSNG